MTPTSTLATTTPANTLALGLIFSLGFVMLMLIIILVVACAYSGPKSEADHYYF